MASPTRSVHPESRQHWKEEPSRLTDLDVIRCDRGQVPDAVAQKFPTQDRCRDEQHAKRDEHEDV